MRNETDQRVAELQHSLHSFQQLRRSGLVSILLMLLGAAIVVGSLFYSVSRLEPVERQIAEKQTELRELEATATELAETRGELARANEEARNQLEVTQAQANMALSRLEQLAQRPLPAPAQAALRSAILEIRRVQQTVTSAETELATAALPTVEAPGRERLRSLIADLSSEQSAVRLRAYDALMAQYRNNPALIPELLAFARNNMRNANGIYNTLVVFSHLSRAQLEPHVEAIREFANDAEAIGPRTRERAEVVRRRLPA